MEWMCTHANIIAVVASASLCVCVALLAAVYGGMKEKNRALRKECALSQWALEDARRKAGACLEVQKRLEEATERNGRLISLGQMAAGIAHDVNNHLSTINTSLGLLMQTQDEQVEQKCVSYMHGAVTNSSEMLKCLVDFSKGRGLEALAVPVAKMLSNTVGLLRSAAGRKATVEYEEKQDGGYVMGNYYELQNAVLNIGLNALDALPEKGGRVTVESYLADNNPLMPDCRCHWNCISVKDNGCGMPMDVKDRIFEAFFTTKPAGRGSGLGLYMASNCLRRIGGTISVESAPGEGTEFLLALPLSQDSATAANEVADDLPLPTKEPHMNRYESI